VAPHLRGRARGRSGPVACESTAGRHAARGRGAAVHDVYARVRRARATRLIELPQMRIDADRGQLGPFRGPRRVVVRAVIDESGRSSRRASPWSRVPRLRSSGRPGGLAAAALSSGASGQPPVPALIELRFRHSTKRDWTGSGRRSRRRYIPLAGGGAIRGALVETRAASEPRLGPPSLVTPARAQLSAGTWTGAGAGRLALDSSTHRDRPRPRRTRSCGGRPSVLHRQDSLARESFPRRR